MQQVKCDISFMVTCNNLHVNVSDEDKENNFSFTGDIYNIYNTILL